MLLSPRTNPELRIFKAELWVRIDKTVSICRSMVLEATKKVHVALNQTKNLRDMLRERFDQMFFLMKKVRGTQV